MKYSPESYPHTTNNHSRMSAPMVHVGRGIVIRSAILNCFFTLLLLSSCADPSVRAVVDSEDDAGLDARTQDKLLPPNDAPGDEGFVRVCFSSTAPGDAQSQRWVREAVQREWQANSGVEFVGWEVCRPGFVTGTTARDVVEVKFADFSASPVLVIDPRYQIVALEGDFSSPGANSSCVGREQYCTEAMAVYTFGRVMGYGDTTDVTNHYLDTVMRTWAPPVLYRGGVLSPEDLYHLRDDWYFLFAIKNYDWIASDSPRFPGSNAAFGSAYDPSNVEQKLCRAASGSGVSLGVWTGGVCRFFNRDAEPNLASAELIFGTGVLWGRLQYESMPVVEAGEIGRVRRQGFCRAPRNGRLHVGVVDWPFDSAECEFRDGNVIYRYPPGRYQMLLPRRQTL